VIAGVDTHQDKLAVAVIDDAGRVVARREVPNSAAGFVELVDLLARHRVRPGRDRRLGQLRTCGRGAPGAARRPRPLASGMDAGPRRDSSGKPHRKRTASAHFLHIGSR